MPKEHRSGGMPSSCKQWQTLERPWKSIALLFFDEKVAGAPRPRQGPHNPQLR